MPGSPVARIPSSSSIESESLSRMVPARNAASAAAHPHGRDSFSLCAAYEVSQLQDDCYSSGLSSTKRLTVPISEAAHKHLSYALGIVFF